MGKYVAYILAFALLVIALDWFCIVDVPYLKIPDIRSSKQEMVLKSRDALETVK
jgi:hypothetical protein